MIIIGIDPGSNHTGVSTFYLKKDGAIDLDTTEITPDNGIYGFDKLYTIGIKTYSYIPINSHIVIESPSLGAGFLNYEVYELIAIIHTLIRQRADRSESVDKITKLPPTTIKKIITGSGKSTKAEVKKDVKKLYGNLGSSSHIYDAVAAGHCGVLYNRGDLSPDVIKKINDKTLLVKGRG